MKEKKKVLLILGVLIGVLSVVGISYAAWQLTKVQIGKNVVTTGCFNVEFTDKNPIQLTNAYPILNEEGKTLTPYEFTITNTCDSEASYQINLEILNDSTLTELGYIREMLNEKDSTSNTKILTSNTEVEKTLENASSSYKLKQGVLGAKESKTFEFRLWMDQDTPAISSVMNKELNSKITVITSYKAPIDTTNMMVAMDMNETFKTNDTYNQGDKYRFTLKKVVFENEKKPIADALEVKDFSVNQDESVLGYYVGNSDQTEVELHIQADGKIKVNPNASYYFSNGASDSSYTFDGFENLDTSEVTDMSNMFYNMINLNSLDISHFDTSNVTTMYKMFSGMGSLTSLDISNFDTSNVTDMGGMFADMRYLTSLDLSTFDTSNVTDMSGMFYNMINLISLDISHFDTSNVTDMSSMFSGMTNLTSLDISHFDTSNVTTMYKMFSGMDSLTSLDISNFGTSNVTDMSWMFQGMSGITSLDLSPLNTSNATNMSNMFAEMSSITSLDFSHFDTSHVTEMNGMFSNMSSLTGIDLSPLDTSNVTSMSGMFNGMSGLTSLDLSHFDTSNVTNMSWMFYGMSGLTSLDLSHFDTSNVTDMSWMFSGMSGLTSLDLSSFNTSNVTDMGDMFSNSSFLTNIIYGTTFLHKENARISSMYDNCPANKPTHSSWNGVFE